MSESTEMANATILIQIWTAPHPLGPWTNMELDINPANVFGARAIKAQPNYMIQLSNPITGTMDYHYTGDLWSSAPDNLKSHDIQYWSPPLEFDDSEDPPRIKPMSFVDKFSIDYL